MVSKFIIDGEVAVLYSPSYGAGWSTWIDDIDQEFITMDSTLVKMALDSDRYSTDEVHKYILDKTGHDIYMGGWSDIKVEWVPEGSAFLITEYDGYESISIRDKENYLVA